MSNLSNLSKNVPGRLCKSEDCPRRSRTFGSSTYVWLDLDGGPSMLSYRLSWHLLIHDDPYCSAYVRQHFRHCRPTDGHYNEDFVASLVQHRLEGPNHWLERYLNRTSVDWLVVPGQLEQQARPIAE